MDHVRVQCGQHPSSVELELELGELQSPVGWFILEERAQLDKGGEVQIGKTLSCIAKGGGGEIIAGMREGFETCC